MTDNTKMEPFRCVETEARNLAQQNLDVVSANGFDLPRWENLLEKLMLTVTELTEAHEAAEKRDRKEWGEELADIWIRVSGMLQALWPYEWVCRWNEEDWESKIEFGFTLAPPETVLWPLLSYLSIAAERWRHDDRKDTRIALEVALGVLVKLAVNTAISIRSEVETKMAKNAKRGKYHGKAKSNG